jgi:membrane-associated phospholipid phosphatase
MHAFITFLSSFDYTILNAVQSIGPKWQPVAYFLSHGVGSYAIMLVVFFLALLFVDKWRVAAELVVVAVISAVVVLILKHFFAIERPHVIDPSIITYDTETGFALPSGHALMSLVILGWVALRHPKSHVMLWGTVIIVLLIGLSRVYLGVHYPSQVVAGWIFGGLLLYCFRILEQKLWAPFSKKL